MAIEYGNDYGYAAQRLRNTVVKLKTGKPIQVQNIGAFGDLVYKDLQLGLDSHGKVEDIDLSRIPLGYVNRKMDASYVMRKPLRRYKQGLNKENVICRRNGSRVINKVDISRREYTHMLIGQYPSLEQCLDFIMNKERNSMAFGRKWSLVLSKSKNPYLFYRANKVGHYDVNSGEVNFMKGKEYLNEDFMETVNG